MTITKSDIPPLLNPYGGDTSPAVFVFAHQDDETLTFGAEIEVHKAAGRYCIGYLVTDGRASTTRSLTGLSVKDFVEARNLEMLNALEELGLDEVHFLGCIDGTMTSVTGEATSTLIYNRYPGASFKVPSDLDDHPDHRAIGLGFRKIKGIVGSAGDIRFYVKPEQRPTVGVGLNTTPGGAKTIAAANEYKVVDKPNGRYGIGWLSVPGAINTTTATPKSTWHF